MGERALGGVWTRMELGHGEWSPQETQQGSKTSKVATGSPEAERPYILHTGTSLDAELGVSQLLIRALELTSENVAGVWAAIAKSDASVTRG